jgi:hypothetical protein
MTTKSSACAISQKNDLMRSTFLGCTVILTVRVANSPDRETVLAKVRAFSAFNRGNDPYGEHDYGSFEVGDVVYFWKFDYYDASRTFFEEDGHRVLTIGKATEY